MLTPFSTPNLRHDLLSRASTQNVLWCVPSTQIYVTLRLTATLSPLVLKPLFKSASQSIYEHYLDSGNGLIAGGAYVFQRNNLIFELSNANNHQCTWRVLLLALWAINNFMIVENRWGEVEFNVYDGGNQVAQGTITI